MSFKRESYVMEREKITASNNGGLGHLMFASTTI